MYYLFRNEIKSLRCKDVQYLSKLCVHSRFNKKVHKNNLTPENFFEFFFNILFFIYYLTTV